MAKTKSKVVVEGFLLSVYSPTEDRLSVQLDATNLTWTKYRNLIVKLQDQLAEVDDAYKKRKTKGRGLRARHRRVAYGTKVSRKRIVKFVPYPSRFANIIRNVRAELYFYINRQCLVLQIMQFGAYRRNIYLLPYPRAPAFMRFIQELNKTISDLNQKIKEYRKTAFFKDVKKTIKRAGLDASVMDREVVLPRISVDLTPLKIDPSIVEDLVEKKYKAVFKKISEEEKKGLEALRQELESKRRELIIKSIESLRSKLDEIVKNIVAKKKLKDVKKDLERLRSLASDVGLEAVANTVISPLIEVTEDPSRAEEILGTADISKEIDGRIAGLIKTI